MDIRTFVVSKETTSDELNAKMIEFKELMSKGKQVALVIKKGALEYGEKVKYSNSNLMVREDIIRHIVEVTKEDAIVSTTGKASRELFEIREFNNQSHEFDFLTVGSMGHSSSIALAIAINKPNKKVWIIDGDGSVLMHMGSMALLGSMAPQNIVHIVINNGAHETVGGMPTVAEKINLVQIAQGCGYKYCISVNNFEELDKELNRAKETNELSFIEVKCSIGAREDLGRPTTTAKENKENFMRMLSK